MIKPELLPLPAEDDGPPPIPMTEVEANLATLAEAAKLPAYVKTRNVREQFQYAFELIGGIPRLAHWAHEHPDKFFALYSKLLPTQVTGPNGGALRIELSWVNGRDTTGNQSQVIDVEPSDGR